MCLIIERTVQPSILQEPMTVYKVLSEDRYAPVFTFLYRTNELYKTEIKESTDRICADDVAGNYLREKYSDSWSHSLELKAIGSGFHFCLNPERADQMVISYVSNTIIFEAEIPAGAEFYEDGNGLGVSNQIIVKEKYEL